MATINARCNTVVSTTGTTWASTGNAVDGTYGSSDTTAATWTNASRNASGTIVLGWASNPFAAIPAGSTINSVTINFSHKDAATSVIKGVTLQAQSGGAGVSTASTCTITTAQHTDTITDQAPTLAELQSSDFSVSCSASRASTTTSAVWSVYYVDVSVDYTAAVLEDSPTLELASFGTFSGVTAGATINSVTVAITQHQSAGMNAPTYQLWDGAIAQIGTTATGTVSTTDVTDTFTATGVTYSQLADLRVRVYAHGLTGGTQSVDAAGVTINYTPAAGVTSNGAQATETDTANAGTARQTIVKAGSQVTDTSSASHGLPRAVKTGTQTAETDTGTAGTATAASAATVIGTQALETDVSERYYDSGLYYDVGGTFDRTPVLVTLHGLQVTELDTGSHGTAVTSGPALRITGTQATDTSSAVHGTARIVPIGNQAAELDTAVAGTNRSFLGKVGGLGAETDTAVHGLALVVVPGHQVAELDTASAGTKTTGLRINGAQTAELDTATAGTLRLALIVHGSQITELDTAAHGLPRVSKLGTQPSELDTANHGTARVVAVVIGRQAIELDTATPGKPPRTVTPPLNAELAHDGRRDVQTGGTGLRTAELGASSRDAVLELTGLHSASTSSEQYDATIHYEKVTSS